MLNGTKANISIDQSGDENFLTAELAIDEISSSSEEGMYLLIFKEPFTIYYITAKQVISLSPIIFFSPSVPLSFVIQSCG